MAAVSVVPLALRPSLSPLPQILRHGLFGPAVLGLLSLLSTTALISFLIYRVYAWRREHSASAQFNQYIILILNLLVADLLQSFAFVISFHWLRLDGIFATDPSCFAQGWFLNLGDTSSGFFVLFIAGHTFYSAVKGSRPGPRTFTSLLVATWALALLLSALGPILYKNSYFTQAGAWCWAASHYENERLAFHYVWVFGVELATILIYLAVFVYLKQSVNFVRRASAQSAATARIDRAAKLMILYPISYICLTLPLSAGRMWSMAHAGKSLPPQYACVAGSLIASTGLIDTLLYSLTRRALMKTTSTNKTSHKTTTCTAGTDAGGDSMRKNSFLTSALLSTDCEANPDAYFPPMKGVTLTKTVDLVNTKRTSTSTLPEENEMDWKENRIRPPMRSYHSHDPGSIVRSSKRLTVLSQDSDVLGRQIPQDHVSDKSLDTPKHERASSASSLDEKDPIL